MPRSLATAPATAPATGLVLTAGGARGAYQAGVLKRISELPALRDRPVPFRIITGASAGAINGAAMAAFADDFSAGATQLAQLWGQLKVTDVFRTDGAALARNGARLAVDLALGGLIGGGRTASLVDATPLRAFLGRHLPLDRIAQAIADGHLDALAITATGYHSGKAFTFVQGREGLPLWNKRRRVAVATAITVDHVRASAAIPIVFAPVPLAVAGTTPYFGDGALRLTTPLSPAIRLGADRLLAIGVRCPEISDRLLRTEMAPAGGALAPPHSPPLAQVCGVFLNAIFLDHLDADIDHLLRMNELVAAHIATAAERSPQVNEPMRVVAPLTLSPSADIAVMARTLSHRMPRHIRYLMDGLGTPDAQSADLASYLLFDQVFTRELIDLGYRDSHGRIDEIEAFLRLP
ncbi:patatin-like phospholipase family protein [Flagellatimonas centrodinii]|uniref:patatin-like phospholipase family protein n=1 Tax=Flagellatimonas centrodinii TaxID=2806210 RepID=UPI001FED3AC1|nr:patatin-like phospholipase family protein [Flagellatimonas centrodinii]ULQ46879.1 patatin-like phospholipase family protein [Flagellatimonas centrodinii]